MPDSGSKQLARSDIVESAELLAESGSLQAACDSVEAPLRLHLALASQVPPVQILDPALYELVFG